MHSLTSTCLPACPTPLSEHFPTLNLWLPSSPLMITVGMALFCLFFKKKSYNSCYVAYAGYELIMQPRVVSYNSPASTFQIHTDSSLLLWIRGTKTSYFCTVSSNSHPETVNQRLLSSGSFTHPVPGCLLLVLLQCRHSKTTVQAAPGLIYWKPIPEVLDCRS